MEMLPPTGWGDVVTRQQLDALELRLEHRFETIDHRFEAVELRFDAKLARLERRVIQWNVATLIAMTGIFGAITRFG